MIRNNNVNNNSNNNSNNKKKKDVGCVRLLFLLDHMDGRLSFYKITRSFECFVLVRPRAADAVSPRARVSGLVRH